METWLREARPTVHRWSSWTGRLPDTQRACEKPGSAALARALADQLALEFGNGGQQRREQPTLRARRVPQGIAKRPEYGARLADAVVEQRMARLPSPLGH